MLEILDSKLRIGISATVLSSRPADKSLDGIGVYTQSLIDEFHRSGIYPAEYTFPAVGTAKPYIDLPNSFRAMALKAFMPIKTPISLPLDVFHVTDYRGFSASCPVVATLYDAIPFIDSSMANSHFRAMKNFILKRSAQYANQIIAISNFSTKELVEHYKVPESKISVVYCGVDQDWLMPPNKGRVEEILKKCKLKRGYFLTVGTLQPRKNISRLIESHDQLSPALRKERPLVVVGKRGWNCEALVKKLLQKIAKGEAYWFSNISSREDLKCIYAGAEAFLFPSLYEGFGLPVLEAFAMGLPVLTSNTTSLPEVSLGIGLEIDPLNINEMAEGMKYLLNLPERAFIVAAGRKRAQELSWGRCAEQTLDVYRKAIAS